MSWQLQEAKSKFSKVVNLALSEGPQIVTRHGEEVVVILSIDEYRKQLAPQKTLYDLLIDSPFIGSELKLERDQDDTIRDLEL